MASELLALVFIFGNLEACYKANAFRSAVGAPATPAKKRFDNQKL